MHYIFTRILCMGVFPCMIGEKALTIGPDSISLVKSRGGRLRKVCKKLLLIAEKAFAYISEPAKVHLFKCQIFLQPACCYCYFIDKLLGFRVNPPMKTMRPHCFNFAGFIEEGNSQEYRIICPGFVLFVLIERFIMGKACSNDYYTVINYTST